MIRLSEQLSFFYRICTIPAGHRKGSSEIYFLLDVFFLLFIRNCKKLKTSGTIRFCEHIENIHIFLRRHAYEFLLLFGRWVLCPEGKSKNMFSGKNIFISNKKAFIPKLFLLYYTEVFYKCKETLYHHRCLTLVKVSQLYLPVTVTSGWFCKCYLFTFKHYLLTQYFYLVYTKTVDYVFHALWSSTQSENIQCNSLIHLQFLWTSDAKFAK